MRRPGSGHSQLSRRAVATAWVLALCLLALPVATRGHIEHDHDDLGTHVHVVSWLTPHGMQAHGHGHGHADSAARSTPMAHERHGSHAPEPHPDGTAPCDDAVELCVSPIGAWELLPARASPGLSRGAQRPVLSPHAEDPWRPPTAPAIAAGDGVNDRDAIAIALLATVVLLR